MPSKHLRVLTFSLLLGGFVVAGCNDDDTAGQGGGQISGDAQNVGGEDAREQLGGGNKATQPSGGTTPGSGDANTVRSDTGTGSEGADAGPVNSGNNQAERQQNR
jgi:predicted small secreted protein